MTGRARIENIAKRAGPDRQNLDPCTKMVRVPKMAFQTNFYPASSSSSQAADVISFPIFVSVELSASQIRICAERFTLLCFVLITSVTNDKTRKLQHSIKSLHAN
jgi:hypothetical protein